MSFACPSFLICSQVLFKLQLRGACQVINLEKAMVHLSLTHEGFLHMWIVSGCDYLPNVQRIRITSAKSLWQTEIISWLFCRAISMLQVNTQVDFKQPRPSFFTRQWWILLMELMEQKSHYHHGKTVAELGEGAGGGRSPLILGKKKKKWHNFAKLCLSR